MKAVRATIRLFLSLVAGAGLALLAERLGLRRGTAVLLGSLVAITPTLFLLVVPRAAHVAFERGDLRRAVLWYRVLSLFVIERQARGGIRISLAACRLAAEEYEAALGALAAVDPHALDVAGLSTWHNNRAYARARAGRLSELDEALVDVDEAIRLRPDVAGFRHTRGVVLLGMGRTDEAIRELDEVWQARATDEIDALLEAERCLDLGVAWLKKGETDYGRDYLARAARMAPAGHWIRRRALASENVPAAST